MKKQEYTFDEKVLGSLHKVEMKNDETTFVGSNASKEKLAERIIQVKKELDSIEDKTSYEYERYLARYSMLNGGVIVIKVGGSSSSEIQEKKDRVLDAVSAVKSAGNGVVVGGGSTLLRAKWHLLKFISNNSTLDYSVLSGISIVANACEKTYLSNIRKWNMF